MAGHFYRTQILLEPDQHQALADIAAREGRSISEIVREMIREQLARREPSGDDDREQHLALLEQIRQHRAAILADNGGRPLEWDVVETIDQMRDEREKEIWARLVDHRD